jgi:hypothetical protein
MGDSNSERSVRLLRSEVLALKEQLLSVCTKDEAAASLVAEKALNRYETSHFTLDFTLRLISCFLTSIVSNALIP